MTYTLDFSIEQQDKPSSPGAQNATVTILSPFHPAAEQLAEQTFAKVVRPSTDLSAEEAVKDSDGILLRLGAVTENMIHSAQNLRIISRNSTGWDNIPAHACQKKGVIVTNMPGGNAKAVAELALTMMLSILRRVNEVDQRLRSVELVRSLDVLSPGLFGKTVGLIGMGDTAYELAKLLLGFGCDLLVYSPTSPQSKWTEHTLSKRNPQIHILHKRVSFEELLQTSDVISLHCPLNASTHKLIGSKEIAKMKNQAVIINVARGGVIDQHALTIALKQGKLGGAGLDVWETEPPTLGSMGELASLPNVICLPHIGGSTEDITSQGCINAVKIMADYFDGKEVINRVL